MSSRLRSKSWLRVTLVVVLGGLLAFRLYLPTMVTRFVNKTLAQIPDYRGHIEGVRIHLWRGAYGIQELELVKKNGKTEVPFFSAKRILFSVQWKELFHGHVVASVFMDQPQLNFITASKDENAQTGIDKSWTQALRELSPLNINHFEIREGEIHLRNYEKDPHVDVYIHHIDLMALNLTNSLKVAQTLAASAHGTGEIMDSGRLELVVKINPYATYPQFDLSCSLKDLTLSELNPLFKRYLAVEVQKGIFELFTEDSAKDGAFVGYVKPLLVNVQFVHLKPEKKTAGEVVKGIFVKIAAAIFKNRTKQQLASKIPLSGRFDNPDVAVWASIGSFLKNAFIKALAPGFEGDEKIKKMNSGL